MSTEIQEQTPVAEPPASPGAMIREARGRARFSLDDLAGQIKLARHTLEALERDDFSALLEPVYVRGYYRKCAKVLDVSEAKLIEAYEARVSPKAPAAPSKLRLASGTELGSTSRLPVPMAAVAAIGAVLVCGFIWFARTGTGPTPPPQPLPVPVDVTPAVVEPLTPAAEAAGEGVDLAQPTTDAAPSAETPATGMPSATPAPTSATAPAAVPGSPVVSPAPSAPPVSTTAAPASPGASAPKPATAPAPTVAAPKPAVPATRAPMPASGTGSLGLSFSATSWVRVDDAAGKTLINGLMRAGDRQTLTGALPMSVFIGNAPGVTVEFGGKPVDLKPHTRDNATARLSLPAAP